MRMARGRIQLVRSHDPIRLTPPLALRACLWPILVAGTPGTELHACSIEPNMPHCSLGAAAYHTLTAVPPARIQRPAKARDESWAPSSPVPARRRLLQDQHPTAGHPIR